MFGAPWVRQFPILQDYIKEADLYYCEYYDTIKKDYPNEINKNQKLRTAKQLFGNDTTLVDDFFTEWGWVEKASTLFNESESVDYQFGMLASMYYELLYRLVNENGLQSDSINGGDG